ncbi:FAD-dependent urate hydroxylase [Coccomyxa sp. Obi]|nr:FAD-dependent urate hydroxylase [Coccomyxa sp. Obi]
MAERPVLIIGAGIGGLATALALHKVGFSVKILEKSDTLREEGASILLGTNGWKALQALGVADTLRALFCRIERYTMLRETGHVLKSLQVDDCAHGPHEIRGAIRNDLVRVLADALPEGTVRFGCTVGTVSVSSEGTTVELSSGEKIPCRVLIGADGAYSKVRAAIGGQPPQYVGWATYRGMATFEEGIPEFSQEFRIIQGGTEGTIVGLYPLDSKRCYYFHGFLASQDEATALKKAGDMKEDLARRLKGYPCNFDEIVARTPEDQIFLNHIGDSLIQPGQTWGRDLVTLVGDAAHPTTPALGQGGCMALEDGVELAAALKAAIEAAGAVSWEKLPAQKIESALRGFERRRSARCAPLVAMARQNGDRALTRRSWLGLRMRDLAISFFAFRPATMFNYMVWDPPTL